MKHEETAVLAKQARMRLGLGAADFGRKLKVTRQTILRWEAGKVRPKEHKLKRIRDLLVPRITFEVTQDEILVRIPKTVTQEVFAQCLEHLKTRFPKQ